MPKSEKQKLRVFFIAEFFKEQTDEEHKAYISDIVAYLAENGIDAEEHAITRDIKMLRDELGMDIVGGGGRGRPFYLASRDFEYEELLALSVGVASSKYLTKKKASDLIEKVLSMASASERSKLNSKVFTLDRVRSENDAFYYSYNEISRAIQNDRKISFSYLQNSLSDADKLIGISKKRKVSPWELYYYEGVYYLFAFQFGRIYTYRLDRMKNVSVMEDEPREGKEEFSQYDIKTYPKRAFNMFGGKARDFTTVEIVFEDKLMDAVIDRFGKGSDIRFTRADKKHFKATVCVYVSKMFFAWVCQFGAQAKLVSPEDVVIDFKKYLEDIKIQYD